MDNGHMLYAQLQGDFVAETEVRSSPVHQYDQAGLMIRLGPEDWLKTSIEYEPGMSRLGAVITNHGWSDWSTQDIEFDVNASTAFRVTRRSGDYLIEVRRHGQERWSQIRLGRLQKDQGQGAAVGLYACSPTGAGMSAVFRYTTLTALNREGDDHQT